MFRGIQKDELEIFWYEALDLLRPALDLNGNYSAHSLKRALDKGDLQLWCHFGGEAMNMAVVTELADYAKRRVCLILLIGGSEMDEWLKHLATIESWAKGNGAQAIQLEGRNGWERVLPDYSRRAVVLQKEI